ARVSKSFTFTTCGRGRCSLITVIPIAGGSSVFGVWLSVDLGDQNPPSSWWVICPNVAGLGHGGKADGVEMTRSRIQLLIVLSAVIVNPSAEALWAQTPSAPRRAATLIGSPIAMPRCDPTASSGIRSAG